MNALALSLISELTDLGLTDDVAEATQLISTGSSPSDLILDYFGEDRLRDLQEETGCFS